MQKNVSKTLILLSQICSPQVNIQRIDFFHLDITYKYYKIQHPLLVKVKGTVQPWLSRQYFIFINHQLTVFLI